MPSILTGLFLILASTYALPTTFKSGLETSSAARSLVDLCNGASNCETYLHPKTGRSMPRFKPGMDPTTEWYHKNVRMRDPHHPNNTHEFTPAPITRRQSSVTYNPFRSTDSTYFGDVLPSDAVNDANNHCSGGQCNESWTYDIDTAAENGYCQPGSYLQIDAQGQWDPTDPNNQGYFVGALAALAAQPGETDSDVTYSCGVDYGDYPSATFYSSSDQYNINRYVDGNLQGFLNLQLTFQSASSLTCENVLTIISGSLGPIGDIGKSFFGAAGALTCANT